MTNFKSNETDWHAGWKDYYRRFHNAQLEVRIGLHVCDVLLPDGRIVEIQRKPLPLQDIESREWEYQDRIQWLYSSEFLMHRITGWRTDEYEITDKLPIDRRFKFVGKVHSIVHHKEPVWVEYDSYFYRLFTWNYAGSYYGKFKQMIDPLPSQYREALEKRRQAS